VIGGMFDPAYFPDGCPHGKSLPDVEQELATPSGVSQPFGLFELGKTRADLYSDTTVTVYNEYVYGEEESPFNCPHPSDASGADGGYVVLPIAGVYTGQAPSFAYSQP